MAASGAPTVTAKIQTITSTSATIDMTCNPSASQWSWRYFRESDGPGGSWSSWQYNNTSGTSQTITIKNLTANDHYIIQVSAKSFQTGVWGYASELEVTLADLPKVIIKKDDATVTKLILGNTYTLEWGSNIRRFNVYVIIGSWSQNIYTKNQYTEVSCDYSLPLNDNTASPIAYSSTGIVQFKLAFLNNNNEEIYESLSNFVVEVPDNNDTKPKAEDIECISINENFPFTSGIFVKNFSKLKVEADLLARYGAKLASAQLQCESYIAEQDIYATTWELEISTNEIIQASNSNIEIIYYAIEDPTGNPKVHGWYEKENNIYILTEDTEVDEEKTYYGYKMGVPFSLIITDSRGFSRTYQSSVEVYDYYAPTGTIESKVVNIIPPSGGNEAQQLVNTVVNWNGAFVDGSNNLSATIKRQYKNNNDWQDDGESIDISNTSSYTWSGQTLDSDKEYRWVLYLKDGVYNVGNGIEYTAKISQTPIAISRLGGGGGVTFFGEAQDTGLWVVENGIYKNVTVGNARSFYGTCSTSGAEGTKTVVCDQFGVTDLVNGTTIRVKFDNKNSANYSTLQLDVNSTGAFPIVYPNGNLRLLEDIKTFVYYENIYMNYISEPTGNPSEQGWYEKIDNEYVQTTDTEVDEAKEYFTKETERKWICIDTELINKSLLNIFGNDLSLDSLLNYSISNTFFIDTNWLLQEVENPSGNPKTEGWYVYNSGTEQYVLTTDTTVQAGVVYFDSDDSLFIKVGPNTEGVLFNLQANQAKKNTYQVFMRINPVSIYTRYYSYDGNYSGWDNWSNIKVEQTRRILIFGDSYFEDTPPYNRSGTNFRDYLTQCLTNVPNVQFDLKSDGGEGFVSAGGTYTFLYDVTNYTSIFNNREVTDIFFVGGYNDRDKSAADIYSGMSSCFSLCHTKYPNAKIHVGHFGWSGSLAGTNRTYIINYSLPSWQQCSKFGAGYMHNSEFTMHDYDLFYSDEFHPNADGILEIAKQVANYIISGTCDVHYRFKRLHFNQGTITGEWTTTEYNVGYKLDNDLTTIYLPDKEIVYTSDWDFSNYTDYIRVLQVATMVSGHKGYAFGTCDDTYDVQQVLPLRGYIQTSSATFKSLSECQFTLQGGFLRMRPYGINSARTGFDTYTGVHALHLIGGAFTIPTLSC